MNNKSLPKSCKVVVIGGGVAGCSVAYHLAKFGWKDTILLERDPTYIVEDVVHYCVANMPGGVPRTSTLALNNATLPFLVKLANKGYQKALSEDKNFLAGLNVHKGQVTYKAVADVFGYEYADPLKVL
jgi:alanine dehydrogenase